MTVSIEHEEVKIFNIAICDLKERVMVRSWRLCAFA
jgi:hypothetical protein